MTAAPMVKSRARVRRQVTMRRQLVVGFGALVALMFIAGIVAQRGMTEMATSVGSALRRVQDDASQSAPLSADVAQTLEAGANYMERGDSSSLAAFRSHGASAHQVQRAMNARLSRSDGESPRKEEEVGLVASI